MNKKVKVIVDEVMSEVEPVIEVVPEVIEPISIPEEIPTIIEEEVIAEPILEVVVEEAVEPVEEIFEDDVLAEDRPPVELPTFKVGDIVKFTPDAKFIGGGNVPQSVINSKAYIREVYENGYSIGRATAGRILGIVAPQYMSLFVEPKADEVVVEEFPVYVGILVGKNVKIMSRPETSSKTLKTISAPMLLTVVDEKKGWAHLKLGGWIPLENLKKINN